MFRTRLTVSHYLALTVALAAGAILALVWYATSLENAAAEKRQIQIAYFVTDEILDSLSEKLELMTYWQDAYENTALNYNAGWVDYQFGTYQDTVPVDAVILVDRHGAIRHLYQKTMPFRLDGNAIAASRQFIDLVRAVDRTPRLHAPNIRRGIVLVSGHVFLGAAGRITPERDVAAFHDPARDIFAFYLRRADAGTYSALTRAFRVSGLEIGNHDVPGKISIPLPDVAGREATRLWWKPSHFSRRFILQVAPLSLCVLLLLMAVQAAMVRRWQAILRDLFRAKASADAARAESVAKTAFLGVLSHELRTPINAILGFSELIQSRLFGPLGSPKYDGYLSDIHQSGRKMLRMVDDLLEIASIEVHTITLVPKAANLNDALESAIRRVEDMASAKRVRLSFSPGADISVKFGDPELGLILFQIVENAVKFSRAGSAVVISAKGDGDAATIRVQDWGIGIDAQQLGKLARPFVQIEDHRARNNGGLGIGLAIARRLLELMGGGLDIESRLDEGTTVTIRVPLAEAGIAAARETKAA